jgi:hypothetical protein
MIILLLLVRLVSGNFIGARSIGSAANREEFQDFTIDDDNVVEVAKLESDGGTANLRLGRRDGTCNISSYLLYKFSISSF